PEAHGHQEIEGPAMTLDDRFIAAGHIDEIPGVQGDQSQGHDLERREDGGDREIELGLSGPVPVVARTDEAAAKIQDGVEIYGAERRYPLHQTHLVENDGNDDGDKELKKSF